MVKMRPPGVLVFAATLAAVSLPLLTPQVTWADFEAPPAPPPSIYAMHAGVTLQNATSTNQINGADLSIIDTAWNIDTRWIEYDVPVERAAWAIFLGEEGSLEGSPQDGVNYTIAHHALAASATTTLNTTFNLPAFGDPDTPSGSYTIIVAELPETFYEYDEELGDYTGVERPYTDADFANWFAGLETQNPPVEYRSLQFEYIAGEAEIACTENCYSNILFLPGIMGSRLHEGSEQLWEANDEEAARLYLDEEGDSINSDIYARGIVDDFTSTPIDVAIYGSFLEDLAQMKTSSKIEDYAAVPYDWRLSIGDIIESGKEEIDGAIFYNRATSTPYIEQTLRRLAHNSRTGKVTIVAHSNGGLVAKALINELGPEAADLVDQVVLIGVPQLGTPQAIGSLLHGYDSGIPFALSAERARDLAINAPMTYQLLPEAQYYQSAGASIGTPVVTFEAGSATQAYIDRYGLLIGNAQELSDFLNAAEGRTAPEYVDLKNPAVANATLLAAAETLKSSIGASWQPPAGITVHQIAGVGEDTLAGITYKSSRVCVEHYAIKPFCKAYADQIIYTPETVVDGDGTVVAPSALAMSDSAPNVKRWWIDLDLNNDNYNRRWIFRLDHKNMLEVQELRTFILEKILTNSLDETSIYISSEQPIFTHGDRMRFILHSPLALSVVDSNGNVTNASSGDIPGATYAQYGEVQIVTVPTGSTVTAQLSGQSQGTFTLEIEEYVGGSLAQAVVLAGVPSGENTAASLAIPGGSLSNAENLTIDYDGDGTVDVDISAAESALYEDLPSEEAASEDLSAPVTPGDGVIVGLLHTTESSTSTVVVATTSVPARTSTEISAVEPPTDAVEALPHAVQARPLARVEPTQPVEIQEPSPPTDDAQSIQMAGAGSSATWYDNLVGAVQGFFARIHAHLKLLL